MRADWVYLQIMHRPRPDFAVDGEVLYRKRMSAGVARSEMAARAGISTRYLAHLENGTRSHPRAEVYARLRAAYDLTDAELLAPPEVHREKE